MDESTFNLLIDFDLIDKPEGEDESFASINLNPSVAWAKFVLTDDLPNLNKERVPLEEFDNLIKTGTLMPIKMARGGISDGHASAEPIGVIANLKKVRNQILGLAALWERERPEDVGLIRNYFKDKKPLQLSWEILFKNASTTDDGITELHDTALRATTLVGMPAYEGRTPILAVASQDNNATLNSTLEETTLEELEQYKTRVAELEQTLAQKDEALSAKDTEITSLKDMLKELDELRQYKDGIEKEKAETLKIAEIRKRFTEANISKEDKYFEDNKVMLLALSEEAISFMIQELVAFSTTQAEAGRNHKSPKVPLVTSETTNGKPSIEQMAEFLRNKQR